MKKRSSCLKHLSKKNSAPITHMANAIASQKRYFLAKYAQVCIEARRIRRTADFFGKFLKNFSESTDIFWKLLSKTMKSTKIRNHLPPLRTFLNMQLTKEFFIVTLILHRYLIFSYLLASLARNE